MNNLGKIAIIGGSGLYNLSSFKIIKEYKLDNYFGTPSSPIIEMDCQGNSLFFLARHGINHNLLPHEVNYRANIFALKKLGVKYIISISAVGSLIEESPPGTFVLPDQFIDWTKGKREKSFFGNGIVGHVSTAEPINQELKNIIFASSNSEDIKFLKEGTYICIEGPQFSSKAESLFYKSIGATIIGMTNLPEAYLAKEAGIAFATLAAVTDYDCWKEEHCEVESILKVMQENTKKIKNLLPRMINYFYNNIFDFNTDNKFAIMTPLKNLNNKQKEITEILLT